MDNVMEGETLSVCHLFSYFQHDGISQNIDRELVDRIDLLVKKGCWSETELKRNLDIFVRNELFSGSDVPKRSNKRFFPRIEMIRNAMKRSKRRMRNGMIDQEYLEEKIKEWMREDPTVNIKFRRKFTPNDEDPDLSDEDEDDDDEELEIRDTDYESEEDDDSEDDEEDDDSDEEEGNTKKKSKTQQAKEPKGKIKLKNSFLFVYQNDDQKRLLERYGNEICLLDATYKTTR